jgi:hypothetical protein
MSNEVGLRTMGSGKLFLKIIFQIIYLTPSFSFFLQRFSGGFSLDQTKLISTFRFRAFAIRKRKSILGL